MVISGPLLSACVSPGHYTVRVRLCGLSERYPAWCPFEAAPGAALDCSRFGGGERSPRRPPSSPPQSTMLKANARKTNPSCRKWL